MSVAVQPPAGFNLGSATAAQRSFLGIPANVPESDLAGAQFGEPVTELQVGPQATPAETFPSSNWSGIVAPQSGNDSFWAASLSEFYEPEPQFATCAQAGGYEYAVYWTGLGGADNGEVAQNGSGNAAYGADPSYGNTTFYWYENFPYNPGLIVLLNSSGDPVPVTQGDLETAETVYEGLVTSGPYAGDYAWAYWWEDDDTKDVYVMANYVPEADWTPNADSAEFITELPGGGTAGPNKMVNYGTLYDALNEAYPTGGSGWKLLTNNTGGYDLWQLNLPDQVSTADDPGTGADGLITYWGPNCG
jgi:hypothetical protein